MTAEAHTHNFSLHSRLHSWHLDVVGLGALSVIQLFLYRHILTVAEPLNATLSGTLSLAVMAMCLVDLSNRSAIQQFLWALMQVIVLCGASVAGIPRLFIVGFMVLAARATLTLPKAQAVALVALIIVLELTSKEIHYYLTERAIFYLTPLEHITHVVVLGRFINFVIAILLAAMCAYALGKERQARIERDRMNAEVESMSRKVERTRIAREIHDSVGHTLTSLNMQIELAQKLFVKKPEKVEDAIATAKKLSSQARRDLQASMQAVSEVEFDLNAAVNALIEEYRQQKIFAVDMDGTFPSMAALPAVTGRELFNIIKEALNNAKKYAQAERVVMKARAGDDSITLEIFDDGKGFDIDTVKKTSFGLRGMKERVSGVAGEIDVQSAPGEGTRLTIKIPLGKGAPVDLANEMGKVQERGGIENSASQERGGIENSASQEGGSIENFEEGERL